MGKGKRIGKNVKFIVNEDSFTGIDDIRKDLIWQKWLREEKISFRPLNYEKIISIFAYNRPSHFKRAMIFTE